MIINPPAPVNIQGMEELQSVEVPLQESPFENAFTTMQGDGNLETELFLPGEELLEEPTLEESLPGSHETLLAMLPVVSTEKHLIAGSVPSDPRVQVQETPKEAIERAEISIDEQLNRGRAQLDMEENGGPEAKLNRGRAQLDMEENGGPEAKMRDAAILTSGTIMYKADAEVEQQESVVKRQLMQQFRATTPEQPLQATVPQDSLQATVPQPLTEFSEKINFNQAINPSGRPNDFEGKTALSKSPITRNIPELSEVFVKTDQKEILSEIDTPLELETGFDQALSELGEKAETTTSKENRPIIAASASAASRVFSKEEAAPNLDQIMSKVNFKENGTREMVLQLTPHELGEMVMKVHQEGNNMAVEMIVGSLEAKHMLEANLPELRARFLEQEDASFDQLQFSVDVEQHSFSKSGQSPEHGGFEDDYIANQQREAQEEKIPVSQQHQKTGSNAGVNIYA